MKIKLYLTLILSTLFLSDVSTQEVAASNDFYIDLISNDKELQPELTGVYSTPLGFHDGHFYSIKIEVIMGFKTKSNLYFEKFSKDLEPLSSTKIEIDDIDVYSNAHFTIIDNELRIYNYQTKSRKEGSAVYCHLFNLEGEKKLDKKVIEVPKSKCKYQKGVFSESLDKKNIIWVGYCENNKTKSFRLNAIKFDSKGDNAVSYIHEFERENSLTSLTINDARIDNKENIIINYSLSGGSSDDLLSVLNYRSKICIISGSGEVLLDKSMSVDETFLDVRCVEISEDNQIYLGGMLREGEKGKATYKGLFLVKLNKLTLDVEAFSPFLYNEDFFNDLGFKVNRNGKSKFKGSYLFKIELKEKGGGYLIANHSSLQEEKEIIVLPFSSSLKVNSPKLIPRVIKFPIPVEMRVLRPKGDGYFSFVRNNVLYIVYTNHTSNIESESSDNIHTLNSPMDFWDAAIFIATIDEKTDSREIIIECSEVDGFLNPSMCIASEGQYLISIFNDNESLYGDIVFK